MKPTCAFCSGLAALAFAVGCSSPQASLPAVYPVTGLVLTENGKPYPKGSLQFRPDKDEGLTVMGDIKEDGTFSLRTLNENNRAEGAPAGSYQVTIYPALGPDRKPLFSTFTVSKKYQVEPKENHFEIRADPPPW